METLQNQEKLPEIQRLRTLLQSVPEETKSEHAWQALENSLFARMDEMESIRASGSRKLFRFPVMPAAVFPQRILGIAAAACLVVLIGVETFYTAYRSAPRPLADSQILGVKGNVTYKTHKSVYTGRPIQKGQQPPYLFKEQVFETAAGATCIVQIDEGSSFILSENTKLSVKKADSRSIDFFLHTGSILASVSKRQQNQTFMIHTEDAECKVIGTIFSVSVSPTSHRTNLTVVKGTVSISGKKETGSQELVQSGQTVSVNNDKVMKPQTATDEQIDIHALSLLKMAEEMRAESTVPTGLLDIASSPEGAKIFINEKFIGKTPLAVTYPSGNYTITLTHPDFTTWEDRITVKQLNSSFITASLQPKPEEKEPAAAKQVARKNPSTRKKAITPNKKDKQPKQTVQPARKDTKDFGFIMNPAFVEALMQMTIGEYQKALVILDSLKELPEISITEKIRIMSKIAACYKGMGNFEKTLRVLTRRYKEAAIDIEKANILWEIINVKANCLQDYEGAEKDILTYIEKYPNGTWIESAYAKLGEIQYITGKYAKAIGTFQYHINLFKSSDVVEKSVYTLANIMRLDIKDYAMAVKWYTKLLEEYPGSSYYGNALFERADCYEKLNRHSKAQKDYKKYLELYPEGHLKALCSSRLTLQE